jgi:hypothetical protein
MFGENEKREGMSKSIIMTITRKAFNGRTTYLGPEASGR